MSCEEFQCYDNEIKEMKKLMAYKSEAGIIKKLIETNRQLSNGSQEYTEFAAKVNNYITQNM
jgi:hypothetical protein